MKIKNEGVPEKSKKFFISTVLYITASVVAIIGIALLADNIYIFKSTVAQYVAQGYAASDVIKSLIPSQLVPGIIQAVAGYGGMAVILLGVGIVNKKISKCLTTLAKLENNENPNEGSIVEQNVTSSEQLEIKGQNDAAEQTEVIDKTVIVE